MVSIGHEHLRATPSFHPPLSLVVSTVSTLSAIDVCGKPWNLPWKPKKDMYLESAQMFLLKVFSNVGFQLNMESMAFPWLSPNIIFQIQWKIGGFNHHLGGRMWTSIIFNAFLGSPWEWPRDPGTAQAKNWGRSTVSLLAPQYFTNKWFPTGNEWNPTIFHRCFHVWSFPPWAWVKSLGAVSEGR
jgi:hypothetical protein